MQQEIMLVHKYLFSINFWPESQYEIKIIFLHITGYIVYCNTVEFLSMQNVFQKLAF